ncbi:EpsG family protein [Candidatus Pelagibacter sp.]|nr:EpsG family protein [Candidatus Pelagibacter sp.]
MLIYWSMYLIPSTLALIIGKKKKTNKFIFFIFGFIFSLLIGFRHEVGSDWSGYLRQYNLIKDIPFFLILQNLDDPAHQLINWIMGSLNFGVYGVNFIYAVFFMIGLIKFSKNELYPWLAISVAIPYIIIVVVMGLTKQGMALGLIFLGF